MENKIIDYDAIVKTMNPYIIKMESYKFLMLSWIITNIDDERIQKIYNWKGDRACDYIDEDGYFYLCSGLWKEVTDFDSGCGTTNSKCYRFVSDMILTVISNSHNQKRKDLQNTIDRCQKELDKLNGK
jgi:hypothetical protein